MSDYRKIYKQHYGTIPKDSAGRTYDIHHIDGNHDNDEPKNLKAVTIQEHYDIHYAQGDWAACLKMSPRMKMSPEEISEIARKNAQQMVENGTHNFLGGEIQQQTQNNRVTQGIHNFQIRSDGSSISADRVLDGTHNLLGEKNPNKDGKINHRRVEDGTHHFLGPENNRKKNAKCLADGTHNFITDHPSKIKMLCPYCHKEYDLPNYKRWHGEKCKLK